MNALELRSLFHMVAEHQDPPVPWDWTAGVCYNVNALYGDGVIRTKQLKRINKLMAKWNSSGCFPVPMSPDATHGLKSALGDTNVSCFYSHYHRKLDMYTGTYGRSRREMCLYIARNL